MPRFRAMGAADRWAAAAQVVARAAALAGDRGVREADLAGNQGPVTDSREAGSRRLLRC